MRSFSLHLPSFFSKWVLTLKTSFRNLGNFLFVLERRENQCEQSELSYKLKKYEFNQVFLRRK